jgi:hypothetical protein
MKIFQTLQEKSSTTQVLFQKQHNSCLKPLFLEQFNKKGLGRNACHPVKQR